MYFLTQVWRKVKADERSPVRRWARSTPTADRNQNTVHSVTSQRAGFCFITTPTSWKWSTLQSWATPKSASTKGRIVTSTYGRHHFTRRSCMYNENGTLPWICLQISWPHSFECYFESLIITLHTSRTINGTKVRGFTASWAFEVAQCTLKYTVWIPKGTPNVNLR